MCTGTEAVAYLSRSGLSPETLAEVWDIATSNETGKNILLPYGFSLALRLICHAQQGKPLRNHSMNDLTHDNGMRLRNQNNVNDTVAPYMGFDVKDEKVISNLSVKTGIPLSIGKRIAFKSLKTKASNGLKYIGSPQTSTPKMVQYEFYNPCLELRPSPVCREDPSILKCIIASNGFLLSFPTVNGGLRVWSDVEGSLNQKEIRSKFCNRMYSIHPKMRAESGEGDSTPSIDIPEDLFEAKDGHWRDIKDLPINWKRITCITTSNDDIVCTGHEDGRIRLWKLSKDGDAKVNDTVCTDIGNRMTCCCTWVAHRSPIRALGITSYGEVWTGSELGNVKSWNIIDEVNGETINNFEDTLKTCQELRRKSEDDKGKGMSAHAVTVRDIKGKESFFLS